MLFNSIDFLIFFPIVFIIYYLCPAKWRYIWLLISSYYFYMQWNPAYILLLFGCTLITYTAALVMERFKKEGREYQKRKKRVCLFSCTAVLLGILAFFKYIDFLIININRILSIFKLGEISWKPDILLPVGISFFTLQAMGYMIDVYREDIYAEKNFMRYALFISFFPQLVAGPIERSKNLLVQLYHPQKLKYDNLRKGILLILWGLFCKMVIADRVAIVVDAVYNHPLDYGGIYVALATILFSFQIYCDFHGYSTIARGVALTLGIKLVDNFNAPYYSKSVKEFWRRWHISLSYWFRDYVYIPLGGNRKGKIRKQGNLLLVFGLSGLWHGASVSFIFWGFLNGVYQVAADIVSACRNKIGKNLEKVFGGAVPETEEVKTNNSDTERFSKNVLKGIATFLLISFAWLFFRAGSMTKAILLIHSMANFAGGSFHNLGISTGYLIVIFVSILLLMLVDYQKYMGKDVAAVLLKQGWWFRAACFVGLITAIFVFGCYGELYDTQQFIYFQF